MRLYSTDEEERIRTGRLLREWTRSGLLDATQGAQLEADLRVDLKRTNPLLRTGLALFTCLIIAASVELLITFLEVRADMPLAVITGLAALACIGVADHLVITRRCYRFGVEEALAVAAVVLLCISGAELTSWTGAGLRAAPTIVALLVGAAGGFGLYRRFGFIYAALGAGICAAAIPLQLDLAIPVQRALVAAVTACLFLVARSKRLRYRDDYPGDEYGQLQAAALVGIYLPFNLQLPWGWSVAHGVFYWCTYVITWVIPLVGLRMGIRERDRELIDASLVLALATLLTNKPYLGWPRYTWDPIVLGVVLTAIAIAVRRWLSSGPGGERQGFTAARLLDADRAMLSLISTASVIVPPGSNPNAVPVRTEPATSQVGGGRSGGGGGDASF